MTLLGGTDGMVHPPDGGLHDHHAAPAQVTINDTTTTIPPGSTANVDITLPRADYRVARILIHGPKSAIYTSPTSSGYEGAYIQATTAIGEAMGYTTRDAGSAKQYGGCWSKQDGSSILTDYIFDNVTVLSSRRIAVQDCSIIGSVLRLVMHNNYGGSSTIWMKGAAILL